MIVHIYCDNDPSWINGKIVEKKGDVTFMVEVGDRVILTIMWTN